MITSPLNHATYSFGESFTISVEASDPDGIVSEIKLYLSGDNLASLNTSPYEYVLNTDEYSLGSYTIKAVAFDNEDLGKTYEIEVTIVAELPAVTTSDISGITDSSAISGGEVISDGGANVTAKGVCWSTSQSPTTADSLTMDGSGKGTFTGSLSGLSCGTTYYVRAFATNSAGTAYGSQVEFTTSDCPIKLPTVTTTSVSNITDTIAQSGGNITDDGGAIVTARGVCWSTSQSPTTADSHTTDGIGTGSFTSSLSGLSCGTTYYLRAYATNSVGTTYGEQVEFTTSDCPIFIPTVTTTSVSNIAETTAQSGGYVTDDGGALVNTKGVCWSTSPSPTISDNHTFEGSETGSYSSSLSGLSCGTTYYVRAFATNSAGTAYGSQVEFTTSDCPIFLPTITTASVSNITETSTQCGGNVTDDGGATVSARGICWSTSQSPTTADSHTSNGSGSGDFISTLSGLSCNTTYYARAYATNSVGTTYGEQVEFLTSSCPIPPIVTTISPSNITETSAQSGGDVTDDGGASVLAKGVCWSVSSNPTIADSHTDDGTGNSSFSSAITGLSPNTTYYVRAYGTNSAGTGYGNEESFKTWSGSVTDYDGNIYQTVVIGDQTWMAENLKTTRYADGSAIPLKENTSEWDALTATDKAYCWYDNSTANRDTYGGLYTWAAAMNGASSSDANPSGVVGVCPAGWHLPSDGELTKLIDYLGGRSVAGGTLKETGTTHWVSPNEGATNESGFTALPGGHRGTNGTFYVVGIYGVWWSSSESSAASAWGQGVSNSVANVSRLPYRKIYGSSVRCVRD